jgi:hypothetical protein
MNLPPVSMFMSTTAAAQVSTFEKSSDLESKSSGAIYYDVPLMNPFKGGSICNLLIMVAYPKSISLILVKSFDKQMFQGLTSL